jgi:GST-like protein
MIDVYTWPTPNGHKIHIMLEETGLAHEIRPVNIRTGEQFKPEFLRISPNNKIPAIVDRDGPGGKPISVTIAANTWSCSGSCSRWGRSAR